MRSRIPVAASVGLLLLLLAATGGPSTIGRAAAASPSFTFSFAGTYSGYTGFSATLDELNRTNSTFAIALGDLGYGIINESTWCDKFHRHFANVEILAGRSDVGAPPPLPININNFINDCPFTLNVPPIGIYGKEYYFDYPLVDPLARFIMVSPDLRYYVDPGAPYYNYSVGTAHYNWTAKAIDDARTLGIPWVIVGSAKNCISAGEHPCDIGMDFFNMLLQKKVDLIIQAFSHTYERSKQLATGSAGCPMVTADNYTSACVAADGANGTYRKGAGSVVVISGTGGREASEFNLSDPYAPYFAAWMGNNSQEPQTGTSGVGVSTFTITRSQISMQTHLNVSYADSFAIVGSSGSSSSSQSPPTTGDILIYAIAAVVVAAAVVVTSVLLVRRKRRKERPRKIVR